MYLDEVLAAQKRGEPRGIASVCSAHPAVLAQALSTFEHPLIEATCNQVNQFGGYSGMRPQDFAAFVRRIAEEQHFPFERITLGGDHLGSHVWRDEPAGQAMSKARVMMDEFAQAGFMKLHLDCSMRLGDDPPGPLDTEVAAGRAAELAAVAEASSREHPRYVIGTEVPLPGGATRPEVGLHVTDVNDVCETIAIHCRAFQRLGLESAWERVVAIVVQPGVEFGDDFVHAYLPQAARGLSEFIEDQPTVYEAHSTDYQTRSVLKSMVRDHFAILKVGPALTFAYREAIFALAMIENEWIEPAGRSKLIEVIDEAMQACPEHWAAYYHGSEREQAFKRKFSLSDRLRYYWARPDVQRALDTLMRNLGHRTLPHSLSSQFLGETGLNADQFISRKIGRVLTNYSAACWESS